ncbi:MAG: cation diffusion facilitator family transporter [Promethearchaeota archaeon]
MKNDNNKIYERPTFINLLLLTYNLFFLITKYLVGIWANSLALQTDAFDCLTDVVMCIIAFIGILFSSKQPNKKFPYGYYKMENLISLIISLFIFFTAYNIIITALSSIIDFFNGNEAFIESSPEVFLFLIVSLIFSLILTLYLNLVCRKTNSPIIKSEARESIIDCFISLSVLVGFIGVAFNFQVLDSIVALIISIFIIKGGYDIFLTSTKTLLDAVIDFNQRTELLNMIEKNPKIKKIEKLEIRSYGKYIFLELEISINEEFPISLLNSLKNSLSEEIMEKFPNIFKIIILIQGRQKNILKIGVPLDNNNGLESNISLHFGESPYFAFLEFEEGNLLKSEIINNKFINKEKRKGILAADWLVSNQCDKIYLKKALNQGPTLIFKNNFMKIEIIEANVLKEVIDMEKKENQA